MVMSTNISQNTNLCQKYLIPANGTTSAVASNNNSVQQQDTVEIQKESQANNPKKNNKKKMIALISLYSVLALSVGTALISSKFWNKGLSKKIQDILKKNKDIFNISDAKKIINKENANKGVNLMNNFNSAKDCYLEPFFSKIPGLKWLSKKSSKLYQDTGIKMTKKAYEAAVKSSDNFSAKIQKVLSNIQDESVKNEILELLSKRKGVIDENFAPELIDKRIDDIIKIMDKNGGIAKRTRKGLNNSILGLLRKNKRTQSIDDLAKGFIAEDLIKGEKQVYIDALKNSFHKVKEIDNELIQKLEKAGLDDFVEKHLKGISDSRIKSQTKLRKAIMTEGNDLFDKMRDVKVGSAPNDIAGMVTTTGLLGVYLAQADDKNQKVEVALTTGVPLGLGMLSTTIATMKMITGFKALALGGATTMFANIIGKVINKKYQKAHNVKEQEINIPTLNSTIENHQTMINQGLDSIKKHKQ